MLKTIFNRTIASVGRRLFDLYCDPVQALRLRALEDTVDYIQANAADALGLRTRQKLWDLALRHITQQGMLLEFGVDRGQSINYFAARLPRREFFGFDSFRGNPEDWSGWNAPKGSFNRNGQLPKVHENVALIVGFYEETLPCWARANTGAIAFIHIDCDLYSSTRTIFEHLGARILPGTVIVFDEYFNYTNWRAHEFCAFKEFVTQRGLRYRYLAYSTQQVAVLML